MKDGNWRINRSPSMTYEGNKLQYNRVRQRVFDILGESCARCGFSDKRALHFDHVDGGGTQKMKGKSGVSYYYAILNSMKSGERFQVLCANCNFIKRAENNEQPVGNQLPDSNITVKG